MPSNPQAVFNARYNSVGGRNFITRQNISYEVNEVGLSIWEMCDGEHTVEEIAGVLIQEYDIDYEQAVADCQEFIEDLRGKGLIE